MSGLQCSPRIAALNGYPDAPAIAAHSTSTMPSSSRLATRTRPWLSFLSVFTSIGYLWTFATTNSYSIDEQFSFVAHFSNDFYQLMAYLMTQSMKSVIKFMLKQHQMNPLLIHRCYNKRISNSFSRQWKLNLMTMKLANTGTLWSAMTYHLVQGQ
jgi:hypothetical protein